MFYNISVSRAFILGAVSILTFLVWRLYRAALPKPITGIPYKRSSASRLLGDIPGALKHNAETGELYSYLTKMVADLNEPIIQVFMRPLSKPWVVVCDFQESYDILYRRTKEFDRAEVHRDIFYPLMREAHVAFLTNDAWSAHRRLIEGAMANSFLARVGAACAYSSVQQLVALWKQKVRLAPEKPFDAKKDAERLALDLIWAFISGHQLDSVGKQISMLSKMDSISNATEIDGLFQFPEARDPDAVQCLQTLCETMETPVKSPLARLHHWLALNTSPSLVKAQKQKEAMIGQFILEAQGRLEDGERGTKHPNSVIDIVLRKELQMATEAGRKVEYDTRVIRDELFALLFGGLGTSTVTMHWMLKYMTRDQRVQQKLRSELHSKFSRARECEEDPTSLEIVEANMPYLDAVLAEISRHSCAIPAHLRMTTVDTTILGHFIPKGTNVFFLNNGPGVLTPPIDVEESKRSKSAQDAEEKIGTWNESDIGSFLPERWLSQNVKGEMEFNPRAGPSLPFGGGLRGCFAKKFVPVKLRTLLTLLIWNFEFMPLPPELDSGKTVDMMTHAPREVFIRLAEAR